MPLCHCPCVCFLSAWLSKCVSVFGCIFDCLSRFLYLGVSVCLSSFVDGYIVFVCVYLYLCISLYVSFICLCVCCKYHVECLSVILCVGLYYSERISFPNASCLIPFVHSSISSSAYLSVRQSMRVVLICQLARSQPPTLPIVSPME